MRRSIGRERLASVLRDAGDLVSVEDAARSLVVSRQEAAKTLWRWSQQGWFRHVRRGLYAPIPPDSPLQAQVLPEPWILVPELFYPGYVGGWSAAEHWDLTEQMFLSVLVCTASGSKPREQRVQGTTFVLKRVKPDKIFGTRPVWYGKVKVQVSDVHRTIVDMLDEPRIGGGIRHVFDCIQTYLQAEQADLPKLVEYADRLGNGAVFKRLGFLLSRLGVEEQTLDDCRFRLTAGNAQLDPSTPSRRLVKRWQLWIPQSWEESTRD